MCSAYKQQKNNKTANESDLLINYEAAAMVNCRTGRFNFFVYLFFQRAIAAALFSNLCNHQQSLIPELSRAAGMNALLPQFIIALDAGHVFRS